MNVMTKKLPVKKNKKVKILTQIIHRKRKSQMTRKNLKKKKIIKK